MGGFITRKCPFSGMRSNIGFLPLNVFTASKGSNNYILFAITAAGVVSCGGLKKSPRSSSIEQIISLFRSFEISKDIQSVQNTHV